MADLMQFEEKGMLEIPLLDSAGNMQTASPKEEAMLLDEAQVTTVHPPTC